MSRFFRWSLFAHMASPCFPSASPPCEADKPRMDSTRAGAVSPEGGRPEASVAFLFAGEMPETAGALSCARHVLVWGSGFVEPWAVEEGRGRKGYLSS